MDAANAGRTGGMLRHALAGIHAGVLGALVMLAWLMAASVWHRRSVWLIPNLFATTFYGSEAYRNEFLRSSGSGLALMIAIYGLGGLIWGILWGEERRPFIWIYGAATGLLVYYVLFNLIWKHVNPLITLYAPDRQLQIGHVLWGMVLARSTRYARRFARNNAPVENAEVVTGQVLPPDQ
jgi:hypothetical protein